MIIFVHFYFPFSVHCYIIIYKGKYIALKEIKKVPKVELLIPYVFKKGLNWSYGLC